MLWHTLSWNNCYKFRICNIKLKYEVVLFLPYKQDCKIGVECMTFIYFSVIEIWKLWLSYSELVMRVVESFD
jgi:hypothetical protein